MAKMSFQGYGVADIAFRIEQALGRGLHAEEVEKVGHTSMNGEAGPYSETLVYEKISGGHLNPPKGTRFIIEVRIDGPGPDNLEEHTVVDATEPLDIRVDERGNVGTGPDPANN